MWQQVTLNRALRAFLRGKTVKVVDLSADVVPPLSEVLERFQQGAMLLMDGDAVEAAVEEDPEQLMKKNAELREQVRQLTEEFADLNVKYAELDAAYQVAQNPAPVQDPVQEAVTTAPMSASITATVDDYDRKDPTASAAIFGLGDGLSHAKEPEPPAKKKRRYGHDTVDEMEAAYQKRKIDDIPKLKSLRAAGWSSTKIAVEFGCSPQTVMNTLKREGIA